MKILSEKIGETNAKLDQLATSHYDLRKEVRRHESQIYDLFQGFEELKKRPLSPKTSRATSPTVNEEKHADEEDEDSKAKCDESSDDESSEALRIDSDLEEGRISNTKHKHSGKRGSHFSRAGAAIQGEVQKPMRSMYIPPCKLMLDSTDPAAVLTWLKEWEHFQLLHNVEISPTTIVSETVVHMVTSTNQMDIRAFYKLTPSEFREAIAKEVVTCSKSDYWSQVNHALRNVKKVQWSTGKTAVDPKTHPDFYRQMLALENSVMQANDFFRHNNSENTPKVQGKYGAAAWFTKRVDRTYDDVVQGLIKEPKEYSTLRGYLKDYMKVVRTHYLDSQKLRSIPYSGEQFATSKWINRNPHADDDSDRDYRREGNPKKFFGGKPGLSSKAKLNATKKVDSESSDSDEASNSGDSAYSEGPDVTWRDHESDEEERKLEPRGGGALSEQYPNWDVTHLGVDVLNAIDVTKTVKHFDADERFDGCIYYTIFGNCNRGRDCAHSGGHNAESSKKTAAWILKKIEESDKTSSSYPKKILTRERR